jgi:hypothetical protein
MTGAPCVRRGKPACGHDQMCGRCRAIWACDRMSDGPTNALENLLDARWAPHEYGKPRPAYYGDLPFVELRFVELLDYANHHGLPREVDTLEDFHDKAAWMVLQGADIAIDGFSEASRLAPRATIASVSGATSATPARGEHSRTWARNWGGCRE